MFGAQKIYIKVIKATSKFVVFKKTLSSLGSSFHNDVCSMKTDSFHIRLFAKKGKRALSQIQEAPIYGSNMGMKLSPSCVFP